MTTNNEMAEFNSKSVKLIRNCCVYKLLDNGIVLERNESIVQLYRLQQRVSYNRKVSDKLELKPTKGFHGV